MVIACLQEALKVIRENGSMNISRNLSLRGEHLKKMLNESPLQQPTRLDEKRAKLKAKLFSFFDVVSQLIYSLCFGKNLYLNV